MYSFKSCLTLRLNKKSTSEVSRISKLSCLFVFSARGGEMYPYCVGSDLEPDGTECDGGSPVRGLEEDDQQVFSENDVIRYTVQLLEALQFLHSHNILHLDIKVSQSGSQLSSTGAQIRLKSASHQP